MKKILFTLLFIVACISGFTQLTNNGGAITVETGATLVIEGDYTSSSSGDIEIDGTVQLKGHFVNNSGTVNTGSAGTLVFNGTAAQQIKGTQAGGTIFNCNVEINNGLGVSLVGFDQTIAKNLTFTNGILTLGAYNLTLGATSVVTRVAGHANASGTGELRKKFASASSFTMPVGDATKYTPVVVAFNSGTFGGAAYVGTKVTASAHPNLPTTSDYINRYWSMSSNDITNINCGLTFNYDATDIVGTAANMYAVKYLGNDSWKSYNVWASGNQLTASNVTGFSDWTGSGKVALTVDLKAYLQGSYDATADEMRTDINGYLPLGQPFNNDAAVWDYNGTESVGAIPSIDITDWVLIELRHASIPDNALSSTIIGRVPGFLKKDGSVVALNGTSLLNVDGVNPFNDNLYVAVYQQNHLGIMANNAVTDGNSDGVFDYDFSTGSGQVYGGTAGYKLLETDVWGMVAGDGNGDGGVYLDDNTAQWVNQFGSENGYYSADFNMDSGVNLDDNTVIWAPNFGIEGPVPDQVLPDFSNVKLKYLSQIPKK